MPQGLGLAQKRLIGGAIVLRGSQIAAHLAPQIAKVLSEGVAIDDGGIGERGQRQGVTVAAGSARRRRCDLIRGQRVDSEGERGSVGGVIGEQVGDRRRSVLIDPVIERIVDLIRQGLGQRVETGDVRRKDIVVVIQFGA